MPVSHSSAQYTPRSLRRLKIPHHPQFEEVLQMVAKNPQDNAQHGSWLINMTGYSSWKKSLHLTFIRTTNHLEWVKHAGTTELAPLNSVVLCLFYQTGNSFCSFSPDGLSFIFKLGHNTYNNGQPFCSQQRWINELAALDGAAEPFTCHRPVRTKSPIYYTWMYAYTVCSQWNVHFF